MQAGCRWRRRLAGQEGRREERKGEEKEENCCRHFFWNASCLLCMQPVPVALCASAFLLCWSAVPGCLSFYALLTWLHRYSGWQYFSTVY